MTEEEIIKRWEDIAANRQKALLKVADSYIWWSGLFSRVGIANKALVPMIWLGTMVYAFWDNVISGIRGLLGGG